MLSRIDMTNNLVCEVCKHVRNAQAIDFISFELRENPAIEKKLRYCKDKHKCVQRAFQIASAGIDINKKQYGHQR